MATTDMRLLNLIGAILTEETALKEACDTATAGAATNTATDEAMAREAIAHKLLAHTTQKLANWFEMITATQQTLEYVEENRRDTRPEESDAKRESGIEGKEIGKEGFVGSRRNHTLPAAGRAASGPLEHNYLSAPYPKLFWQFQRCRPLPAAVRHHRFPRSQRVPDAPNNNALV